MTRKMDRDLFLRVSSIFGDRSAWAYAEDVLLHMRSFIDGLLSEAEEAEAEADCAEEAPPCWLTGLPSEMQVRFPEKRWIKRSSVLHRG